MPMPVMKQTVGKILDVSPEQQERNGKSVFQAEVADDGGTYILQLYQKKPLTDSDIGREFPMKINTDNSDDMFGWIDWEKVRGKANGSKFQKKDKFQKKGEAKNNSNNRSFALSYVKDCIVAGKIGLDLWRDWADEWVRFLDGLPGKNPTEPSSSFSHKYVLDEQAGTEPATGEYPF